MEYFDLFGLPAEIVQEIFQKLTIYESIQSGHLMISKNWSSTLWKAQSDLDIDSKYYKLDRIYNLVLPGNIKRLKASAAKVIEFADQILSFHNLQKITTEKLDSNVCNIINKLTSLYDLLATNNSLTKDDLVSFANSFTRLTAVNILNITNVDDWPNISNLVNLRFASFPRNSFTPAFYSRLLAHTNLAHLNVGFCRITKTGMDSICQLTQLKQISLLKLPNQADPADAWLQFSKLTSLTALACHIPVDAAHQVSKFVKLKSLNLHPEDYQAPFDMNLYSTLTALEEVDLGTSFTKFPTTWTNLKRFKAMHARIDSNMNFDTLTCLRLFVADLDPGACHNLSKLTNLVELRLLDQTYYKNYTDIYHLSKCQNLRSLCVTADSTCADIISKLSTLTWLEIFCPGGSWPEEDIFKLTVLSNLVRVNLVMNSKPDGIEKMLTTRSTGKK